MIEDTLTVRDPSGLHARSARVLVDCASEFQSESVLQNDETRASADSILEVMMLAAHSGTELHVEIEGEDAEEAFEMLEQLFSNGFERP